MGRLSARDALGTTFRVVFRNLPTFLATQGPLLLAAGLLALVVGLTLGVGSAMFAAEGQPALAAAAIAVEVVGLLLAAGIAVASMGVGIHAADAALRGERIRLADAWALARPRVLNLLATVLLGALVASVVALLVLGAVRLFEPGSLDVLVATLVGVTLALYALNLYLFARWGLALPVAMLDHRSPLGNYAEANALTAGSRGALMGAVLVLLLGYLALGFAMSLAATMLTAALGLPDGVTPSLIAVLLVVLVLVALAVWVALVLLSTFLWTTLTVVAYRRLATPAATDFEVLPDDEPSFVL